MRIVVIGMARINSRLTRSFWGNGRPSSAESYRTRGRFSEDDALSSRQSEDEEQDHSQPGAPHSSLSDDDIPPFPTASNSLPRYNPSDPNHEDAARRIQHTYRRYRQNRALDKLADDTVNDALQQATRYHANRQRFEESYPAIVTGKQIGRAHV